MKKSLLLLSLCSLIGCGDEYTKREGPVPQITNNLETSQKAILSLTENPLPLFEVHRQENLPYLKLKKIELKEDFNFEIYQNQLSPKDYYLLPKILFPGGLHTKQRISQNHYGNGFVKLSIPVTMVSGLQHEIVDIKNNLKTQIPHGFKISKEGILKEALSEKSDKSVSLKTVPGCPDYAVISFDGQAYQGYFKSDYNSCQVGKLMRFEVRMTVESAEKLLHGKQEISFQAYYDLYKLVHHGKRVVRVDILKLLSSLEAQFNSKNYWSKKESLEKLNKLILNEEKSLKKDYEIPLELLSHQLFNVLFSKKEHGYSLKYDQASSDFSLSWDNIERKKGSMRFALKTQLSPASRPVRKQLGYEQIFDSHHTLLKGDRLEIDIFKLTALKQDQKVTKTRKNNPVCLKSIKVCDSREMLTHGFVCTDWSEKCVKSENRWKNEFFYESKEDLIEDISLDDASLEDLSLSFISDKKRVCSLKDLNYHVKENNLLITLENTQSCEIFGGESEQVYLEISNNLVNKQEYKKGKEVINWKGEVEKKALLIERTNKVHADIQLSVSGYRLINY